MARLIVLVEGQTEEAFVNALLVSHLVGLGFHSVTPKLIGSRHSRSKRGGIPAWQSAKADIVRTLKNDTKILLTTMVDYYGMPTDWPGRSDAVTRDGAGSKASCVEGALADAIDESRFVPFVMMHEFEALLFSDCGILAQTLGCTRLAVEAIRSAFDSPEDINDSEETAPSKRLTTSSPRYEKILQGIPAAREIGLSKMRQECPHFDEWLTKLEKLPRSRA